MGPCRKTGNAPVMASDAEKKGPGGAEIFTDLKGRRWMVYHGWGAGKVGYDVGGARSMRLDRVAIVAGALVASGPTTTTQTMP